MWPPRSLVVTDRKRLDAHGDQEQERALLAFVAAVAAATLTRPTPVTAPFT